jgi:hypothetical protein
MAKNKTMTKVIDTACVIGIERSYSKKNEEYYYDIEMVDAITGNYFRTYVGEDNFNYKHWKKTIDTFIQNNGKKTVILRGTIRVWKDNVINADSKPIVVDELDMEQFLQVYADNFLK